MARRVRPGKSVAGQGIVAGGGKGGWKAGEG